MATFQKVRALIRGLRGARDVRDVDEKVQSFTPHVWDETIQKHAYQELVRSMENAPAAVRADHACSSNSTAPKRYTKMILDTVRRRLRRIRRATKSEAVYAQYADKEFRIWVDSRTGKPCGPIQFYTPTGWTNIAG